jgi:uncharacterized protein YbjT (DUF2867 family)
MTTFAIIGGTGTIGRHIADALREDGHAVRVLSRHDPEHPVDLSTGAGLEPALAGCEVVVDAANGSQRAPEAVLVDGCGRWLAAAGAAGVRHALVVSIVGCDRVPTRYYRAKVRQEELVRASGLPFTIARATQFHELVDATLAAAGRWRLSPRAAVPVQPVAAAEAGRWVAGRAAGEPAGVRQLGGPEIETLSGLARAWTAAAGRRVVPLPVPVPGRLGRALRAGGLTNPAPDARGTTTFAQWLRERA